MGGSLTHIAQMSPVREAFLILSKIESLLFYLLILFHFFLKAFIITLHCITNLFVNFFYLSSLTIKYKVYDGKNFVLFIVSPALVLSTY